MKIAIDASQIIYETGVSVYTKNLIRSLLKIDKINSYLVYGGSVRKFYELKDRLRKVTYERKNTDTLLFPISPTMSDWFFNRSNVFNIDYLIGRNDVFHASDWSQPATSAYKVTTVHDLVPLLFPKMTHPRIVDVHKRRLERVKRYADKIIVPSNTTRDDLLKLGYSQDKIVVIPEAVDTDFIKPEKKDVNITLKKYRINEKYLLVVGSNPRKNIDRIISAFERIRTDLAMKLVVIGEIKKPISVRNVIFLGHIPINDVVKIYCGAEALVYPSLYEGFGLPILEAFAMGIPVLTSNIGGLKELAGGAALLVDPYSTDSIRDGITKLLSNRIEYIKAGKEELKKYSWEKTALMTLEVYKSCLK